MMTSSLIDHSVGFGGKYGVQTDRKDEVSAAAAVAAAASAAAAAASNLTHWYWSDSFRFASLIAFGL